jgi:hypothetical protein
MATSKDRPKKRILTEEEAVEYLGGIWELQTLRNWRTMKRGPKFVKGDGGKNARVGYRVEDLEEWLDHRARESGVA